MNIEPTPARINQLPAWAQLYIYDLSTRADPAGDIKELASLREQRDGLVTKVLELKREIEELKKRR